MSPHAHVDAARALRDEAGTRGHTTYLETERPDSVRDEPRIAPISPHVDAVIVVGEPLSTQWLADWRDWFTHVPFVEVSHVEVARNAASVIEEAERVAAYEASDRGPSDGRSDTLTPVDNPQIVLPPRGVFVSYRRVDSAWAAVPLYDRLRDRFGAERIFKDIDSIDLGDDFVDKINEAVASAAVLLVLIGQRWLSTTDDNGRRRLDDPNDFVRLEVEAGLTRDVRVIPVLVDGASMPDAASLPEGLKKLSRRQALKLDPERFDSDMHRLLKVLDRTLGTDDTLT